MIMNNTTLEICINNIGYDKSVYISNIVWYVCGFIGVIIGIPGHILHIITILRSSNRKQPTSLYYIAIAICEFIFLIGVFWLWCATMLFIKTDPREIISCGIFYSILIGSTILSNLYLASVAIDGSLLVLSPVRYRLFLTRTHVILRLIFISLIIILLMIPHHFYLYYNPKSTLFLCEFHSFVQYRRVRLWSFIHAILFVSIPSLIVCIASFILLHNRCKSKQIHNNNLSVTARRMQRNSVLIVFVAVGTFFTLLPVCILEIFIVHDRFFYHEVHCSRRWKVYKILLNCFLGLLSVNYSIKFYVHLIISTSFRTSFIELITCNSIPINKMNTGQPLSPLLNQNKGKTPEL